MKRNLLLSRHSGCLRWGVGAIVALFFLSALLFLAGYIAEKRALAQLPEQYPPPGEMVDVGPYVLHLYCTGDPSARPVVFVSPGAGTSSLHWALVMPEVSTFTRICVYDRPGSGWSFVQLEPRTYGQEAEEVHTLLQNAGVSGPFILVGHSYGGGVAQLYATRYPEEITALVLVDSVAPGYTLSRLPDRHVESDRRNGQVTAFFGTPGIFRVLNWFGLYRTNPYFSNFPPDVREVVYALDYNSRNFAFQKAATETALERESELGAAGPLPEVPLIVFARGIAGAPLPGEDEQSSMQAEQVWQDAQRELAAQASNSTLIVAEESGHNIHVEEPQLIVDAIRTIVERARAE